MPCLGWPHSPSAPFHSAESSARQRLSEIVPRWLQTIIHNGHLGVAVFFVLSGFVMSHSLFGYRMNLNLLGRFTLRRSLRLDPSYWIAIAISLAFGALAVAVVQGRAPEEHPFGQLVSLSCIFICKAFWPREY